MKIVRILSISLFLAALTFHNVSAQNHADMLQPEKNSTQLAKSFQVQIKGNVATPEHLSIFDAQQAADQFILNEVGGWNKDHSVHVTSMQNESGNQVHIRLTERYKGILVYGTEAILHGHNQAVTLLNGQLTTSIDVKETTPKISSLEALANAKQALNSMTIYRELTANEKLLLHYNQVTPELMIYHNNNKGIGFTLAWHMQLRPNLIELWDVFVDARTGTMLHAFNHSCAADGPRTANASDINTNTRTINTYQVGSSYYLIDGSKSMFNPSSILPVKPEGVIWTLDAQNTAGLSLGQFTNTDNTTWSAKAVSAHYNAGLIYDYFKNIHGQVSINNQGGNIVSVVNVTNPSGLPLDNLYWNGQMLLYGNGSTVFRNLVGSLDMAAHEFTHGVIQSNANLEYQGQSGAINESMADIFGCMLDRTDWTIGEDVVRSGVFPSGALRSLLDPHNSATQGNAGWQPAHMSEYVLGTTDNGNVHLNSGILNKAFYLLATNITTVKAEKIYFRALSTYLTRYAQFTDLRFAVQQAAADLFGGSTSSEAIAVGTAFDAVGIYNVTNGLNYAQDIAANVGAERILTYDPNYFNSIRLAGYRTDGTIPVPLGFTPAKSRPSVTDDGTFCVFVDTAGKIRKLTLQGTAVETVLFPNNSYYTNIAVARDGSKYAVTTANNDTSVFVYEIQTNNWYQFKLTNPNYTAGFTAPGGYFAESLEWDFYGEQIMFTGRYRIGDSTTFRDIALLRVWNNLTNGLGDGTIEKIVSENLSDNVLMNPAYARNSPYIITYEAYNKSQKNFRIYCKNLLNGKLGLITVNNMEGVPTYSRLDDKLLFSSYDDLIQDTAVRVVTMDANKYEGISAPTTLIPHTKWPVWYTQGTRKLFNNDKQIVQFSLPTLTPPVYGVVLGDSILVRPSESALLNSLVSNVVTSPFCKVEVGNVTQINGQTKNDYSVPVVLRLTARDNSVRSYTVVAQRPSKTKEITSFSFQQMNPVVFGDINNDTIIMRVPPTTDVTDLIATYSVSAFATVSVNGIKQVSGTTPNDYFTPLKYKVTAYDSTTRDYTVIVKSNVGLKEMTSGTEVSVYPNPANQLIHAGIEGFYQYALYSVAGQVVHSGSTRNDEIQTGTIEPGMYFILIAKDDKHFTAKFIKQ